MAAYDKKDPLFVPSRRSIGTLRYMSSLDAYNLMWPMMDDTPWLDGWLREVKWSEVTEGSSNWRPAEISGNSNIFYPLQHYLISPALPDALFTSRSLPVDLTTTIVIFT